MRQKDIIGKQHFTYTNFV